MAFYNNTLGDKDRTAELMANLVGYTNSGKSKELLLTSSYDDGTHERSLNDISDIIEDFFRSEDVDSLEIEDELPTPMEAIEAGLAVRDIDFSKLTDDQKSSFDLAAARIDLMEASVVEETDDIDDVFGDNLNVQVVDTLYADDGTPLLGAAVIETDEILIRGDLEERLTDVLTEEIIATSFHQAFGEASLGDFGAEVVARLSGADDDTIDEFVLSDSNDTRSTDFGTVEAAETESGFKNFIATSYDNADFDLSNWNLTLPVDADFLTADGGDGDFTDDEATEIKQDDLEGTEYDDMFYYDTTNEAMIFHADFDGATTSGAKGARCELREVDEDGNKTDWSLSDTYAHILSATLFVSEIAVDSEETTGRVIVGQVHGSSDELCRLYLTDDGTIYYTNQHTGTDGEERSFYFENADGESPNISLGETFSYIIQVTGGKLIVAVYADGETYEAVATDGVDPTEIISYWDDDLFYRKGGVYNQVDADSSTASGASEAGFYDIDINDNVSSGTNAWLGDSVYEDSDSTVEGTSGDESLGGTTSDDLIYGYAGDDVIYGYAGDDTLSGDDGDDTLYAGTGNATLNGGAGADLYVISDPDGIVTITDFSISDGDKIDLEDVLENADGFIEGSAWDAGYVVLTQSGDDTEVYVYADGISESAESNLVAILTGVTATDLSVSDFILANNLETSIYGTDEDDTLNGTSSDDSIKAYAGDDVIYSYAGDDSLWGGSDDDTIYAGDGNDTVKGEDGDDVIYGYGGDDTIRGDDGNDTIEGGDGDDYLLGGDGEDEIYGGDGEDILNGQNDDDRLYAGSGSDSLTGGGGADDFVFTDIDSTGTIEDFGFSNVDEIDLSSLLADATGFSENTAFDEGYVVLTQSGDDTNVYLDLDGSSGSGESSLVAIVIDTDYSKFGASDFIL